MIWPTTALLSILLFWVSLIALLTKWPRSRSKSISQHSASFKESFIFFTAVQAFVGFILYIFVIRWFIPYFKMSVLFTVVYTVTAWLQIISAFIPDTMKGKASVIHQRLANAFAVGMLLTTILVCAAPTITGWPKLLFYLAAIYMIYSMTKIIPAKGKPHLLQNYLMFQVIYIVSFQVAFLAAIFFK